MRSPEVSLGRSISVASRPSIAPSLSRSFGESRSFAPSLVSRPSPVASIIRNTDVFNPNISVSVNTPKLAKAPRPRLGGMGGEKKPFSFAGTKPLEAPKSAPMADRKIPDFSFKNTSVLAKNNVIPGLNRNPGITKPVDSNPKDTSKKLESLFGPKLDVLKTHPKGAERFGGMKVTLPVRKVESIQERIARLEKIPMVPKVEIAAPRSSTVALRAEPGIAMTESIQERIARLEKLPMVPFQKSRISEDLKISPEPLNDSATQRLSDIVIPPKGNERFQHLPQLTMVKFQKPAEHYSSREPQASREVKPQIVIPTRVEGSQRQPLLVEPKPELLSEVRRIITPQVIGEIQTVAKTLAKAAEFVQPQTRTNGLPGNEIAPPRSWNERDLAMTISDRQNIRISDEQTLALKANPEFKALIQNRTSLKSQGFTDIQLDRLTRLRLQSQKMPETQVAQWMTALQSKTADNLVVQEEIDEDERAMKERELLLERVTGELESGLGKEAKISGQDIVSNLPSEFTRPKIRSQILGDSLIYDGSITHMKKAILNQVKEMSVPVATRIAKQISRQFRAVKRTQRAYKRVDQEEVRRVLQEGTPVRVVQMTAQLDRGSAVG